MPDLRQQKAEGSFARRRSRLFAKVRDCRVRMHMRRNLHDLEASRPAAGRRVRHLAYTAAEVIFLRLGPASHLPMFEVGATGSQRASSTLLTEKHPVAL